jgi:hypothetical protein
VASEAVSAEYQARFFSLQTSAIKLEGGYPVLTPAQEIDSPFVLPPSRRSMKASRYDLAGGAIN